MSRSSVALAMTTAIREYLLQGHRITRLEALVFFGVSNLTDVIHRMRHEGWIVRSQRTPYAKALRRVNEECKLEVPKSLAIREITLIEYWVER